MNSDCEKKSKQLKQRQWKIFDFKLDKLPTRVETTSKISIEEWGSGGTGTNFLVEIEETSSALATNSGYFNGQHEEIINATTATINGTNIETGPKIIVRTEEVLIVGLVLMLWVGAIVLFFNRWGKIRMLEPYQPKFQQQHRSSCPLVDMDSLQSHPRTSVSRMSMGMINQVNMPTCQFATCSPNIFNKGYNTSHSSPRPEHRPRQNSVFVGPSCSNQFMMLPRPPRKTRSAMDLHTLTVDAAVEQV